MEERKRKGRGKKGRRDHAKIEKWVPEVWYPLFFGSRLSLFVNFSI